MNPTVWDYLETIAETNPETAERINKLVDEQDEDKANEVLHAVWSWFE